MTISDLPAVNAGLNALATLLLLSGYACIKTDRKIAHRNCMAAAFVVSCVFLTTYVLHKILVRGIHTPFGGEGLIRAFYYAMLASHILLAMAIVPALLLLAMAPARGHSVTSIWKEVIVLALKFGVLHILFSFSGLYSATLFPPIDQVST